MKFTSIKNKFLAVLIPIFMLLIELPDYKRPSIHTIYVYVREKVMDYISKAGTTIFVASVVMWFLLNFGLQGYTSDMTASIGSEIGRWLTPIFAPLGLGYWQIVTAILAGISAKEVVVSSCAVLFGIANINSDAGMASMTVWPASGACSSSWRRFTPKMWMACFSAFSVSWERSSLSRAGSSRRL